MQHSNHAIAVFSKGKTLKASNFVEQMSELEILANIFIVSYNMKYHMAQSFDEGKY